MYVSIIVVIGLTYAFWKDGFKGFLELFLYMFIGIIVILAVEKLTTKK